jgi:4-methylaminobutanoate oxidase (formaldehyde-forming)
MATDNSLPEHASVVVIGGGAMGCSTLYHLAKSGVSDAVLLERDKLTSGTTWHSAAQVRALRSTRNMTNLIKYSVQLYQGLEAETGQSTGWIQTGSLSIATNPDRLTHIRRQEAVALAFGARAWPLDPGEAAERWPLMNASDVVGAVWSPDDGRVNPSDLCAALSKGARARGARIFEHTPVTGILTRGGRVAGVETGQGTIRCDAVVVCSGLWSRQVAAMAGVAAPLLPCEHFYLLTKPVPGAEKHLPTLSDHDGHLYIRDDSQGLLVGCFEPGARPIDPERLEDFAFQLLPEDWDHFEPMMRNALHRLPVLETAEVRMLLNGPESFTPDGSFLLGEAGETRGLFLGCGMNSVGLASSGGAGMALAHTVLNGHPPADLGELDPKRFPACFDSLDALMQRIPDVLGRHYEIGHPGRQMPSARRLRRHPLDDAFADRGAHLGQVFGFERPLYFDAGPHEPELTFARPPWFEQVGREVMAAHRGVAVFDQSTFGKIRIQGPDAETFLDRVCSNDLRRAPGRVIYTAMLNERGGFESDLTAIRLASDDYRLMVGTSSIRRDLSWLQRSLRDGEQVSIEDETEVHGVLAVMGPDALRTLERLGDTNLAGLARFHHTATEIAGVTVSAARVSYVGEAGYELTCSAQALPQLYESLLDSGAVPAGLYAQTSMRIEKRFLAMGHELDGDVTPVEAGLEFALAKHGDFVGAAAVRERQAAGVESRLVSIVLDDECAVPLGDEPIYMGDTIVGQATSASFGYRVGRPILLGYMAANAVDDNGHAAVSVDIARCMYAGSASFEAAFDPQGKRMRQ